ncbi:MAG: M28 family peptidase [Chloroflexi bacterium]|nr:M28 family peptidase [Chloroflexota bacterium]MBI4267481.1 M28 family peptidase [Chloroflexota bacterium]
MDSFPDLMSYVRALEGKNSQQRGDSILAALQTLGIVPVIQQCRLPRIRNIIVDFSSSPKERSLLFSAHYDCVRGSPGANDNASAVAVLLGLCHKLSDGPAPVRVVFFDREEAWLQTPFLRLGLLGSFFYVLKNSLKNVTAAYNLEFCGMGDFLGIWPVSQKEAGLAGIKRLEQVAAELSMPFRYAHIPWMFLTSDHLPFRLKGIPDAVTLSLLPASQVPGIETFYASLSVGKVLSGWRRTLPEPLSVLHTTEDTSGRLSEDSLRLMLSLLLKIIEDAKKS